MKVLLVIALLMASSLTLARGGKWKETKDFRVSQMGKRITMLQTAKSCFSAAISRDEFKACKEPLKAARAEIKAEGEAFRAKMKNSNKKYN
ncbi:MAG: hypothetical protein ACI9QD_000412 [Thermoproteota archaeon]|jgi:hypothetical protein